MKSHATVNARTIGTHFITGACDIIIIDFDKNTIKFGDKYNIKRRRLDFNFRRYWKSTNN